MSTLKDYENPEYTQGGRHRIYLAEFGKIDIFKTLNELDGPGGAKETISLYYELSWHFHFHF